MKNFVILVLTMATIVTGYLAAVSRLRLKLEGLQGKTAVIARGDVHLPISAAGEIRAARRVEIKAEASGEVLEITRRPGDRVEAGDLLIRLNQDDEQRSVDRARQEVQIAEAQLATSRLVLEQSRTADLANAQAQVDQLVPSVEYARFRHEWILKLDVVHREQEEVIQRATTYASQQAQLDAARAMLERARLAIPRAEQEVKKAEAAFESARATLGDAEKRLAKTNIVAPIDGVLADVRTQVGEVIQGGRTTLTGGTLLAIILDMDRLIVRAEVDEADIGRILAIAPPWARPGREGVISLPDDLEGALAGTDHPTTVTVEAYRDLDFAALIERIYPEPRSLSNVVTYFVDVIILTGRRDLLLAGMRADVHFTAEHAEDVVLCPNEAIREGPDGRLGVYIPKAGSPENERLTQFVPVRLGLDDGNYVEIREGLSAGDVVYTRVPVPADRDRQDDGDRRG